MSGIVKTSPSRRKCCELCCAWDPSANSKLPHTAAGRSVHSVAGGHVERENKVASGKKFECEERKKERKNWELGGGAAWTGGQLRLRLSEGKMEFWAEERAPWPHFNFCLQFIPPQIPRLKNWTRMTCFTLSVAFSC